MAWWGVNNHGGNMQGLAWEITKPMDLKHHFYQENVQKCFKNDNIHYSDAKYQPHIIMMDH